MQCQMWAVLYKYLHAADMLRGYTCTCTCMFSCIAICCAYVCVVEQDAPSSYLALSAKPVTTINTVVYVHAYAHIRAHCSDTLLNHVDQAQHCRHMQGGL